MQHPVLDTIIGSSMLIVTASAPLLLADSSQVQQSREIAGFILPLIGGVFFGGAVVMLNPNQDTRSVIIGRSMFAILASVTLPSVIGMIHPALDPMMLKPQVLALAGGICAAFGYILILPFTRGLYARAQSSGDQLANLAMNKVIPQQPVSAPQTSNFTINTTIAAAPTPEQKAETSKIIVQ